MQLIQKNQERFRAAQAIGLLLLYLASWAVVSGHSWLHHHDHSEHTEVHSHDHHDHGHDHHHAGTSAHTESGSCENQDPCHLRVYHHLASGGCQHAAHWVPVQEDCQLCDCLLSVVELEFNVPLPTAKACKGLTNPDLVNRLVPIFGLDAYPLRGPPSLG